MAGDEVSGCDEAYFAIVIAKILNRVVMVVIANVLLGQVGSESLVV